ncbi:uncharacterized protein LOC126896947 [Daktulosphaira vitifoliae]|uniref:uncharacterized protein LOC126896947 n=1 Tax=Daktulosphaira vitifoliae TaxID=58002 RepID=UPI0021A99525|nr:uncharacterized protein LOC126896947 [Daktulosphaira vitifoliae]
MYFYFLLYLFRMVNLANINNEHIDGILEEFEVNILQFLDEDSFISPTIFIEALHRHGYNINRFQALFDPISIDVDAKFLIDDLLHLADFLQQNQEVILEQMFANQDVNSSNIIDKVVAELLVRENQDIENSVFGILMMSFGVKEDTTSFNYRNFITYITDPQNSQHLRVQVV